MGDEDIYKLFEVIESCDCISANQNGMVVGEVYDISDNQYVKILAEYPKGMLDL